MNSLQRIHQDSGKTEYYTPRPIVDVARKVMRAIDLDPASSPEANRYVEAANYFTIEDDGLNRRWHGRVWLNHPFSRADNAKWIQKLVDEYKRGNVTEACCICYAATSEQWFAPLFAYPQCYLSPRTNYLGPDGKIIRGVAKGSVVTYLGGKEEGVRLFFYYFSELGHLTVPLRYTQFYIDDLWYGNTLKAEDNPWILKNLSQVNAID